MSEFSKKQDALVALIGAAKERPEDTPHQLQGIMPQVSQAVTSIYDGAYQWYQRNGAPGGDSHDGFSTWLTSAVSDHHQGTHQSQHGMSSQPGGTHQTPGTHHPSN